MFHMNLFWGKKRGNLTFVSLFQGSFLHTQPLAQGLGSNFWF